MTDTFRSWALNMMGAMSLTYCDKQWSSLPVSCAVLMNLTFSGSNESNNGDYPQKLYRPRIYIG